MEKTPITIQNHLEQLAPNVKKIRLKSIIFFVILFVVVTGTTWIKFTVSPYIEVSWGVGAYLISAVAIFLILIAQQLYLLFTRTEIFYQGRDLYFGGAVIAIGFIVIIFIEMLGIFAIPTTLVAFISAPLFKKRRDAFTANLFCNFLVLIVLTIEHIYPVGGFVVTDRFRALDIVVSFSMGVVGGAFATYFVSSKPGRLKYILKGLAVAAFLYVMIIGYALIQGVYREPSCADTLICRVTLMAALSLGLVAALSPLLIAIVLQPILESVFNLLTDARLVDFCDHNSPLIKRLRLEAPGTFSHSLVVASFAEMCAVAIGENPYLARAAAYYHDVGKLENPQYYKENQGDRNLHDEILPEVSVEIIKNHTEDGLVLCDKYNVPREISHVTVQHHGTLLISLFYNKAKSLTDNEVDAVQYSYHGVKPRSKIAAIIMICDAAEAAIRSMDEPDGEKIDNLLSTIILERINSRQFEKCEISLKDLTTIKNTIIGMYGGLYHARLKYPDGK